MAMYQITADSALSYPVESSALAASVPPGQAPHTILVIQHWTPIPTMKRAAEDGTVRCLCRVRGWRPLTVRNPARNPSIEYSMNTALTPPEQAILESLEAAIRAPRSAAILAGVTDAVSAELAGRPHARLAWRPIPLDTYDRLPDGIASSWVFVLRAACTSGAERHPNSIQRFLSYRGSADMQTWNGAEWVSHVLSSDPQAPISQRWLSIPTNVWHRPVMGGQDWAVVSFHTAADDQLIEERPQDDENPNRGLVSVALYAGRQAR